MSQKQLWLISSLASAGLLVVLVILWSGMDDHDRATSQLVNMEETERFLQENWESKLDPNAPDYSPTIKIPTGVFIHSITFFNSTEVHLSGYIWQKYQLGVHDNIMPQPGEVGFVLPEQINTASDIDPREMYRVQQNGEEVIGWYFEATLKQEFDYSTYPFDDKTVWIKLWAKDFPANVVLVPDFESYLSTGIEDTFGIDPDIVMGAWIREDTYFDYALSSYDTDFGIDNYVGQ